MCMWAGFHPGIWQSSRSVIWYVDTFDIFGSCNLLPRRSFLCLGKLNAIPRWRNRIREIVSKYENCCRNLKLLQKFHFSKTSFSGAALTCKWRDGCRELFFYSINSFLVDSNRPPNCTSLFQQNREKINCNLPLVNKVAQFGGGGLWGLWGAVSMQHCIALGQFRSGCNCVICTSTSLYKYEWQRSSSWAINYTCTHPLRSHKNPFQPLGRGWKKWNGIENGEGRHKTWNYICF